MFVLWGECAGGGKGMLQRVARRWPCGCCNVPRPCCAWALPAHSHLRQTPGTSRRWSCVGLQDFVLAADSSWVLLGIQTQNTECCLCCHCCGHLLLPEILNQWLAETLLWSSRGRNKQVSFKLSWVFVVCLLVWGLFWFFFSYIKDWSLHKTVQVNVLTSVSNQRFLPCMMKALSSMFAISNSVFVSRFTAWELA